MFVCSFVCSFIRSLIVRLSIHVQRFPELAVDYTHYISFYVHILLIAVDYTHYMYMLCIYILFLYYITRIVCTFYVYSVI